MKGFSSVSKIKQEDKKSYQLYCLLDGVYTQVVYEQLESDGNDYYKNVEVTNPEVLSRQKATNSYAPEHTRVSEFVTTTTTTPTSGTVTTTAKVNIDPVAIFSYTFGVTSAAFLISDWKSSFGTPNLTQSTTANKPLVGKKKGGITGDSALYFDGLTSVSTAAQYMTFDTALTLSGDFTIFAYVTPIAEKYIVLLGKAADANMYVQFLGLNQFNIGLGSGKTVFIDLSATPLVINTGVLLTVQRSGTTVYVRVNGRQVGTVTVVSDDLVVDQFGRVGTSVNTLAGYAHHLSIYNGYITTTLTQKENAIIKQASRAQLV